MKILRTFPPRNKHTATFAIHAATLPQEPVPMVEDAAGAEVELLVGFWVGVEVGAVDVGGGEPEQSPRALLTAWS